MKLCINDIKPMRDEKVQFYHTVKHLYNAEEHWRDIIPDLGNARERACSKDGGDCIPAEFRAQYPDHTRVSSQCKAHVLQDYNRFYCPKYKQQLREAANAKRYGRRCDNKPYNKKKKNEWWFVGDEGVVVCVKANKRDKTPVIRTAYRPTMTAKSPNHTDFFKKAVRKLRDKTSWDNGGQE